MFVSSAEVWNAEAVLRHSPNRRVSEPDGLTPRQKEVLGALGDDLSAKQVAARLGISPRTVEFHIAAIRARLRLGGIASLVRYAIREGIINP